MANAKMQSLRVLPLISANLCFPVDGIVGELNAALGQDVAPFDFGIFYAKLGSTVTVPNVDPSALQYNSAAIHEDPSVKASMLVALRAEGTKAALDKSITARFNTYWQKYSNIAGAANQIAQNNQAKVAAITALTNDARTKLNSLIPALQLGGMGGVVTATSSTETQTFNSSPPGSIRLLRPREITQVTRITIPPWMSMLNTRKL